MTTCPECNATVGADDNFCQECGADLLDDAGHGAGTATTDTASAGYDGGVGAGASAPGGGDGWREEYSTTVWVVAVVVGLLTLPLGLVIPAYFYLKASGQAPVDQSALEVWTVILLGVVGIAAVEIGGRRGAKVLWGIVVALVVLAVLGVAVAL